MKVTHKEDQKAFNQQMKVCREACKPAERKQFGVRSITGLTLIFAGVIVPVASRGTAFVIAGVLEVSSSLWEHSNDIERITRLAALILALALLGFFLYRWDRKR